MLPVWGRMETGLGANEGPIWRRRGSSSDDPEPQGLPTLSVNDNVFELSKPTKMDPRLRAADAKPFGQLGKRDALVVVDGLHELSENSAGGGRNF
jgi:hypothetical protein